MFIPWSPYNSGVGCVFEDDMDFVDFKVRLLPWWLLHSASLAISPFIVMQGVGRFFRGGNLLAPQMIQ